MLDIKEDIQEAKNIINALKICGKEEPCEGCIVYTEVFDVDCSSKLMLKAAEKLEFFLNLQDPMGLANEEEHHDDT